MNHSFVMADCWHRELPEPDMPAREKRVELRNLHQQLIRDIQVQLQIYPTRVRPEDCGRISSIVARIAEISVSQIR
jgi:1,3-beta-glucan synthase